MQSKFYFYLIIILVSASSFHSHIHAQDMSEMWDGKASISEIDNPKRGQLFRDGNYAMFIHWGLYSELSNVWNGKTYYGIGEWLMHEEMANIPTTDYVSVAKNFNPIKFDAKEVVQLAKDAGMKYIIVTSKHHDGFAMYDSKASNFNIVKSTPFGRDPMKELSQACKDAGLGFGFYYSHNQDWTTPYGTNHPRKMKDDPESFDSYFKYKCLPQVEEITTKYGDIELVWFDTPGGMKKEYIQKLVDVVRKNQPNAYVSGRAGHGLGDYSTFGDMEVPIKNTDGIWETVDVTNDSWGYAWYDNNWKSPKQILELLISTVARGGTYMLNIGPKRDGSLPRQAVQSLRSAGEWIHQHPDVVYAADSSPWGHALPWGDITRKGNKLSLCVYQWPTNGKLYIPGLKSSDIHEVKIVGKDGKQTASFDGVRGWTVVDIPFQAPNKLVSLLEIIVTEGLKTDNTLGIDPGLPNRLTVDFAEISNCNRYKRGWMEKFGEWKHVTQVDQWSDNAKVSWTVDVQDAGDYLAKLNYAGEGRLVWKIENSDGCIIQNQQNSSGIYADFSIGWLSFSKAGKHTITVSLVEGNMEKASLTGLQLSKVIF